MILNQLEFGAKMNLQNETKPTTWTFLTVQQFSSKHQAFPTGGLRSLIFNERSNGLAKSGAVVRIGRKVLINEAKFFDWVAAQYLGATA